MKLGPLQNIFDDAVASNFQGFDFDAPHGEHSIFSPNSLTWKIYKNPVVMFIGGVSAVIMQLSEPRVRAGVWDNTTFKDNAALRVKRTGLAAMATVYGSRSSASKLIEKVNALHACISGTTKDGQSYRANDPELLRWVQETVSYSTLNAYSTYIRKVSPDEVKIDYPSRKEAAALYGVQELSENITQRKKYFQSVLPTLSNDKIIKDFISIIQSADLLPSMLRPFQSLLVKAAINNVPNEIRDVIGLDSRFDLPLYERRIVKLACSLAEKTISQSYPAVRACERLGLPSDYLFSGAANIDPTSISSDKLPIVMSGIARKNIPD